jgi:hypothetical protein
MPPELWITFLLGLLCVLAEDKGQLPATAPHPEGQLKLIINGPLIHLHGSIDSGDWGREYSSGDGLLVPYTQEYRPRYGGSLSPDFRFFPRTHRDLLFLGVAVTHSLNRLDEFGAFGVLFDFLPEQSDMLIQGAAVRQMIEIQPI